MTSLLRGLVFIVASPFLFVMHLNDAYRRHSYRKHYRH